MEHKYNQHEYIKHFKFELWMFVWETWNDQKLTVISNYLNKCLYLIILWVFSRSQKKICISQFCFLNVVVQDRTGNQPVQQQSSDPPYSYQQPIWSLLRCFGDNMGPENTVQDSNPQYGYSAISGQVYIYLKYPTLW